MHILAVCVCVCVCVCVVSLLLVAAHLYVILIVGRGLLALGVGATLAEHFAIKVMDFCSLRGTCAHFRPPLSCFPAMWPWLLYMLLLGENIYSLVVFCVYVCCNVYMDSFGCMWNCMCVFCVCVCVCMYVCACLHIFTHIYTYIDVCVFHNCPSSFLQSKT